jgi:serine/threonine protein kinase
LKTSQHYAIKEYFVTGSSGQAQLQHEARVLIQLHHPNLPAFHEAFNERGHYFVVLSYIEGSDLTDRLRIARTRNEPIPLAQVMGWILAICDAVQFLHTQQPVVIHRDIKPDNIRIMPDGTAILVDLGNAKATADGARTLFFIRHQGTPGYAPQEQYPGGSGTDVRSDVYALGGTLYFALTAHEPPSVSTRNQSIQQGLPDLPSLQEQLANNPPEESAEANAARQFRLGVSKPAKPAPRHLRHLAQLGTLPPELLNQLNRIIARAMAMRQKDRYQSVAEFSRDLRKVITALPAPQPPSPPPSRPIDPNSTQPDLPLLYDAIQKARESAGAGTNQGSSSAASDPGPPSTPAARPVQPVVCPRCGATVLQQASYCPGCGSSLSSLFKGSSAPAEPNPSINQVTQPNKFSAQDASHNPGHNAAYDVSLDKTMVIPPQVKARAQSFQPTPLKSEAKPAPAVSPPRPQRTMASSMTQVQPKFATAPPPQAPPVPPATTSTPPVSGTSFTLQPRIIIMAAIVILLLLIAILLLFFIAHGHNNQALNNSVSMAGAAFIIPRMRLRRHADLATAWVYR